MVPSPPRHTTRSASAGAALADQVVEAEGGGVVGDDPGLVAAVDEPIDRRRRMARRLRPLVVGDDGDAVTGHRPASRRGRTARGCPCRRGSASRSSRRLGTRRRPGRHRPRPHAVVDRRVGDDAAARADLDPPGLELRLHQQHHRRPRLAQRDSTGMTLPSEMNETSATTTSAGPPIAPSSPPDVCSFEHGHPCVVARTRVQLAVADVEGDDGGGAARQQAVREPAGRGADVDGPAARRRRCRSAPGRRRSFSPPRPTKRAGGRRRRRRRRARRAAPASRPSPR